SAAIGFVLAGFNGIVQAQNAPVNLPPGVQDVLKLSQAGVGEDVIMAQVKNTGATYNLNADQLIYLTKSGVSQNVIRALITGNTGGVPVAAPAPVPATAPSSLPPPPTTVPAAPSVETAPQVPGAIPAPQPIVVPSQGANFDSFHDQLAPYGTWMQVAGYGWCWRPTMSAFDPNWHPYGNGGHWIYTEDGWNWESDYPWGNIAFHYGRWLHDSRGWLWVPGYDWAPAWVTWRQTDGYVGWAPLPPGAAFRAGVGLEFNGRVGLGADFDFGLGPDAFVFVGYDHFWDHDLRGLFVPRDRREWIFHHSIVMNGYRFDHGRFIVDGFGRDRIGLWTHHDVHFEAPMHDYRHDHFEDRRGFHDDRDRRFERDRDHH
ncbi:MAG TPA: DUF6600 domain-containing protein, partial [Verrucomicrobiae bacterium]|nr:DUF6600 domain-containing protein [Verrucomicrobiae bacterium]